jgi:BolA protein
MTQSPNMQENIRMKLDQAFTPDYVEVINESNKHNVAPGSESHFRVTLVSRAFEGCTLIQRHRLVNDCLKAELDGQIHALALHTLTSEQWAKRNQQTPDSPDCKGGGK